MPDLDLNAVVARVSAARAAHTAVINLRSAPNSTRFDACARAVFADVVYLVAEVERLRKELERAAMYERLYFEVQEVLDGALGTEEEDGAGAGIVAEVALLVEQRDEARLEVGNLTAAIDGEVPRG